MIILSISVQSIEDISTLTARIAECRDAHLAPIVHIAGLPRLAATFADDAAEESSSDAARGNAAIADLRKAIAEAGAAIWAGGWSGLTQRHLSQDELEWDLTWSITNPRDTGLTRLLGVAPECIFPVEITGSQARELIRSRIAKKHPLCLGYPTSVPGESVRAAAPEGSVHGGSSLPGGGVSASGHLVLHTDGGWRTLSTGRLDGERGVDLSDASATGLIHAVLPSGFRDSPPFPTEAPRAMGTDAWRDALVEISGSAPDGEDLPGYFTSGLAVSRWADPAIMAARARGRASRRPSRERTRTILAAESAPTRRGDERSDPFRNRELQGGVTGSLRLDTDTIGAVLLEGRLAGLTVDGTRLTPPVRSQGFFQTPETVTYLETVNAAWFTGIHVRGVHETASLGGAVTVETTLFAHDDIPGVTMAHRVQVHRELPADARRVTLMETVIAEIAGAASNDGATTADGVFSTGITGAIAESDGTIRACALDPLVHETYPWEWARDAVALRLDLPAASVWIAAAHPGATVTAPFSLGVRPTRSGLRLVWYPLGFAPGRDEPFLRPGAWTVAYRITSGDAPILRVEDPVVEEIEGFTASP